MEIDADFSGNSRDENMNFEIVDETVVDRVDGIYQYNYLIFRLINQYVARYPPTRTWRY